MHSDLHPTAGVLKTALNPITSVPLITQRQYIQSDKQPQTVANVSRNFWTCRNTASEIIYEGKLDPHEDKDGALPLPFPFMVEKV